MSRLVLQYSFSPSLTYTQHLGLMCWMSAASTEFVQTYLFPFIYFSQCGGCLISSGGPGVPDRSSDTNIHTLALRLCPISCDAKGGHVDVKMEPGKESISRVQKAPVAY